MKKKSNPTTICGRQNGSSVETRTRCAHTFARLGADLHARSVIIKQNFCIGAQEEVWHCCWLGKTCLFLEKTLHCIFRKSLIFVLYTHLQHDDLFLLPRTTILGLFSSSPAMLFFFFFFFSTSRGERSVGWMEDLSLEQNDDSSFWGGFV